MELEHYKGVPARSARPAAVRGAGGAQIYLKREDLNHTGAHKVNNTVGWRCRRAWANRA